DRDHGEEGSPAGQGGDRGGEGGEEEAEGQGEVVRGQGAAAQDRDPEREGGGGEADRDRAPHARDGAFPQERGRGEEGDGVGRARGEREGARSERRAVPEIGREARGGSAHRPRLEGEAADAQDLVVRRALRGAREEEQRGGDGRGEQERERAAKD